MSMHSFFQPLASGDGGIVSSIGLTHRTPRGLFLGSAADLYLVCDSVEERFAVVLDHETIRPFTRINLGGPPLDHGSLCGLGELQLERPYSQVKEPAAGNLRVGAGTVEMFLTDGHTEWGWWETVLHGESNVSPSFFSLWAFIDMWEDLFFVHDSRYHPQTSTD